MAKKSPGAKTEPVGTRPAASPASPAQGKVRDAVESVPTSSARPSALVDTRVIYCGDNLEQLQKLPDACVDLIYIDPPFNSNRNYEVFWGSPREILVPDAEMNSMLFISRGETKEKRAFEDRHASTQTCAVQIEASLKGREE